MDKTIKIDEKTYCKIKEKTKREKRTIKAVVDMAFEKGKKDETKTTP